MFDDFNYVPPDYLDRDDAPPGRDAILAMRLRQSKLFEPQVSQYREAVQFVRDIRSNWFDFSNGVTLGRAD